MQASDEKYDLVIVTGFTWSDALIEVAPSIQAENLMWSGLGGQPNVWKRSTPSMRALLVGVATAMKAIEDRCHPKFGSSRHSQPTITSSKSAYPGRTLRIPKAEFVEYYANDWGSPNWPRDRLKTGYDSGVYANFLGRRRHRTAPSPRPRKQGTGQETYGYRC
jgi:basic membrane protein A